MQRQETHALWDELADFGVSRCDAALNRLMSTLAERGDFLNVTWAGAVRLSQGKRAESPDVMQRWRVAAAHSLEGRIPPPHRVWDQMETDPSMEIPLRDLGRFRTYSFRRDLPEAWFHSPFYREHYGSHGVEDAMFVGFPLNSDCESHFGFWSGRVLDDQTLARVAYALRGLKWFHRRLMLSRGLFLASSPLTPTEQKVTHLLLTDASEKQIAHQLKLAESTVHQYVVAIYRKFGVRSRVGLMSLWLNRRPTIVKTV